MRYAYTCMLHHSATGSARLSLNEAHLRAICQTDIRLGSYEWTQIYQGFGNGDGSGATSSTSRRDTTLSRNMVKTTSNEGQEALRQLRPLKIDLHFPYAGGLFDVVKQFPQGQYGFSIRVDTGGADTVVKVMTPSRFTKDTRVAEFAFWNEMDVYLQLRSLWGTHVPCLLTDDNWAKAFSALTAVHEAGVAHRDVLLRNFVMDGRRRPCAACGAVGAGCGAVGVGCGAVGAGCGFHRLARVGRGGSRGSSRGTTSHTASETAVL
ncbi:Rho-associated protein kinase 2, partial [Hondaea fermentalgiana]